MPHFRAADRPMWWAVGEPIVASGMTEAGGLTVTGLDLYNAEDENELLALVIDKAGSYNPLPAMGEWCEANVIYGYDGGLVICRQSHTRTEHAPSDIPALFTVYREDAGAALDWIAGERVEVGTWRVFNAVLYVCLQAHQCQTDWTPPQTLGTLWATVALTAEWAAGVAFTGDNTAGAGNGDVVTYGGNEYRCLQSHTSIITWTPPVVPALWLAL